MQQLITVRGRAMHRIIKMVINATVAESANGVPPVRLVAQPAPTPNRQTVHTAAMQQLITVRGRAMHRIIKMVINATVAE